MRVMRRGDRNAGDDTPSSTYRARQQVGKLRGGVQISPSVDGRLKLRPERGEFQYFPIELRERKLRQLPNSCRGGSLSGVGCVAAVAARRFVVLPQKCLAPNPPKGHPSRGRTLPSTRAEQPARPYRPRRCRALPIPLRDGSAVPYSRSLATEIWLVISKVHDAPAQRTKYKSETAASLVLEFSGLYICLKGGKVNMFDNPTATGLH
ncbi:hypothetical protein T4A_13534 [Trichinella pseudospiralis]|uniref:Uncharacterized protein n=1 Tax=Trichinella pseudospiralis TaxID=6337 RepID=A0A0V1DSZ3_TRIPS|nr:hypothetical protein T4A_13534 [Trichinella pseudospiralis]